MGVDPSSQFVGLSIIDVDFIDNLVTVRHSETIKGSQCLSKRKDLLDYHPNRFVRLNGYRDYFTQIINRWQPHNVACEAAYMGRFPAAYQALVECITTLQLVVYDYNPTLSFSTYDPPTVKKAVGASGKSKDKEDIFKALSALPLIYDGVVLENLDEHACDSLAVALTEYRNILNN